MEKAIALYARYSPNTLRDVGEQLERAFCELRWQGLWDQDGQGEYKEIFTTAPTNQPSWDTDLHFSDHGLDLSVWPLPDDSDLARLFRAIELGQVQAIVVDDSSRIFGDGRELTAPEIREFLECHEVCVYDSGGCGELQY